MSFLDNLFVQGVATALKTAAGQVNVGSDTPTAGDLLTAVDANNAVWSQPAAAVALARPAGSIAISSDTPAAGDVLTAVDANNAVWSPPAETGAAAALVHPGGSVDVSSDTPAAGDVLTAVDADNAVWTPPAAAAALARPAGSVAVNSDTPTAGDLLTAVDANNAVWSQPAAAVALARPAGSIAISSDTPAAGDVLTAVDANNAVWSPVPPPVINPTSPYLSVPASPDAFDDEFTSGSADLATRGYTVIDAATGTTLTRSGDINPWNATGPAGNTYWSTLIGGWLFLQGRSGVQIDFYKSLILAPGDTYFMRTGGTFTFGTTQQHFHELGFYAPSGAQLDNNNRVYNTQREFNSGFILVHEIQRVTAGVTGSGTGNTQALGTPDIRGIRYDSGTLFQGFVVDSGSGRISTTQMAGAPAAASLTRVGVRNQFTSSGIPQIAAIDFIRKKSGNAWLV
jgi:hypothetical protein